MPASDIPDLAALRRQQEISKSFEASLQNHPDWPGGLIIRARQAIRRQDYRTLDGILTKLEGY